MDDITKGRQNAAYTLDDVIGQDDAISEIRGFLNMKMDPIIAEHWRVDIPNGLLLTGPPGTGKTMTVRALVNETADFQLTEIKYSEIASKWLDESVVRLSNLFDEIEKASNKKHVIVFIDEIDSFLPDRMQSDLHHSYVSLVNTFIQWMDGGLTAHKNVTVIGATNNYTKLDKAAVRPGRFDRVISFKPLANRDIVELLKLTISKKRYEANQIDIINWELLSSKLIDVKLSGAIASAVVNNIASRKMKEHYQNINSDNGYSKCVPSDIIMMDENICPNPITTEDFILEINKLVTPALN